MLLHHFVACSVCIGGSKEGEVLAVVFVAKGCVRGLNAGSKYAIGRFRRVVRIQKKVHVCLAWIQNSI
ncbi:hypothetical protein MTR_7g028557 [Medicago truncatula]|uniref:Uncharacterized protein n=1 Tax=Medicago truncatula TaxID=3880 RepID=A0A072TXS5_MEDTR|nr:hypothetical protein MTR_7g028557 [Medicago truncatula]